MPYVYLCEWYSISRKSLGARKCINELGKDYRWDGKLSKAARSQCFLKTLNGVTRFVRKTFRRNSGIARVYSFFFLSNASTVMSTDLSARFYCDERIAIFATPKDWRISIQHSQCATRFICASNLIVTHECSFDLSEESFVPYIRAHLAYNLRYL